MKLVDKLTTLIKSCILIYNQTKLLLKNTTKNILHVEPNTKEFKTFHFHKHKELRELGLGLL